MASGEVYYDLPKLVKVAVGKGEPRQLLGEAGEEAWMVDEGSQQHGGALALGVRQRKACGLAAPRRPARRRTAVVAGLGCRPAAEGRLQAALDLDPVVALDRPVGDMAEP